MLSKSSKSHSPRRVRQSTRPLLSSSILVAVDPHADRFAAAVYWRDRLVQVVTVGLRTLQGILYHWGAVAPVVVLCEDQFVGRSFFTVKSLVRAAGQVQALAILGEYRFELVNPATWQKPYPLPKARDLRVLMTCQLADSVLKAAKMEGKVANPDEAAAVLMGMWRLHT